MKLFHQASLHLALQLRGVMKAHILFLCWQNNLVDRPEDLKQWRIGGRGADAIETRASGPNSFIFMQLQQICYQIIGWRPLLGNSGSATLKGRRLRAR